MEKLKGKEQAYLQEIEGLQHLNRRILEEKDAADERFEQRTFMYEITIDHIEKQNTNLEDAINKLKISEKNLNENLEKLESILKYVEKQKNEIQDKNRAITQSIEYAKRIQTAILPTHETISTLLNDYFLYYQPKDIVSGDFYWVNEINDKTIVIVGDCTGHGVPGAIMASIANVLINQVVLGRGINTANEIVFALHQAFVNLLAESINNIEGADISVCVIDKKAQTLTFSGAMHTLFYVQADELKSFRSTLLYLGRNISAVDNSSHVATHTIDISIPTMVYLSSDGYYDQFGGDIDKPTKFMVKRFKDLLLNVSEKPTQEQKRILRDIMAHWTLQSEQTDDIVVFGMRF